MMNEGCEFQTDGAAHRKVNGTVNSKVSDERNVTITQHRTNRSDVPLPDNQIYSRHNKVVMNLH